MYAIRWHHAANSKEALDAFFADVAASSSQSRQPVGLEVDVRMGADADRASRCAMLRHDPPLTASRAFGAAKDWLSAPLGFKGRLSSIGTGLSAIPCGIKNAFNSQPRTPASVADLRRRLELSGSALGPHDVVKFDVKELEASTEVIELMEAAVAGKQVQPSQLWFNMDVVRGGGGAPVTGYESALERLASAGFTLSLGWTTSAYNLGGAYTEETTGAMFELVTRIAAARDARQPPSVSRPISVTFAVRFEAVKGSEDAQKQLKLLLEKSRAVLLKDESSGDKRVFPAAFLTFWRGRGESITDKDASWAVDEFPGCTVDRS